MKKRVLFAATEATPLIKQTEIADFNGLTPQHLTEEYETAVILPFYPLISTKAVNAKKSNITFTIPVSDSLKTVTVWEGRLPNSNIKLFLLANKHFDRAGIYGNHTGPYPDNSVRYSLFSRAVLEFVDHHYPVDIIISSDWYTALIPVFLKEQYQDFNNLHNVKTVLAIFDLSNQGIFWVYDLPILNLGWNIFTAEKLEFYNDLNFLKGGIVYADTVFFPSKSSLDFLHDTNCCHGLHGILQFHNAKLKALPFGKESGNNETKNLLKILKEM
ncbi:glycogen/starch synthase [bacterium]|nr:glycogen/starch synthase [bacterium]